jgi:O-antigen ligase
MALLAALLLYPLYPKVGLLGVSGTYIPVRIDDLVTAVLAAVWLLMLVRQRRAPVFPLAISALAALWMVCALISLIVGVTILHSIKPAAGIGFWAKPLEYLLIGLIGFDLIRNRLVSVRAVLAAVFTAGALVITYGVLERIGVVKPFPFTTPIPGVITSTVGDPHELASYMGLIVLLALALWPSLSRPFRLAAAAGLIPAVFVMFNSGARSEYVTLGLVVAALAFWKRSRSLRGPALVTAAVVVLMFFSPLAINAVKDLVPHGGGGGTPGTGSGNSAPTVTSRFGDPTLGSSLASRFFLKWPAYLRSTASDPIFGLGPSAGTEAVDGYYIRALLEFGIVGLAVFLALLVAIWRGLRRAVTWEIGLNRDLAVGLLAGTAFVAVVGILIDTWVASRVMELYWPLLGVTLGIAAVQPAAVRQAELAVA